jgi:diaminopimelate decarboxylase
VKRSKGRRFVVLDTGIHHLGGMAGLGRLLPVGAVVHDVPAGAGTGPVPSAAGTAEPDRGALVGPLCTPADVLARDTAVGHLAAGDIVEIPNAGAYGLTASLLAFLGRPIAVEVVVDQGDVCGASRLELGRVPVAELLPGGVPPAAAVPAGEVRP